MKPTSKEEELAQLEARKQAILQGMGQGTPQYPSVGDFDRDARVPPRDRDGIMTMSDAPPAQQYMPVPAPTGRSMYPEQDAHAAEIAALQRRLAALQGY